MLAEPAPFPSSQHRQLWEFLHPQDISIFMSEAAT